MKIFGTLVESFGWTADHYRSFAVDRFLTCKMQVVFVSDYDLDLEHSILVRVGRIEKGGLATGF